MRIFTDSNTIINIPRNGTKKLYLPIGKPDDIRISKEGDWNINLYIKILKNVKNIDKKDWIYPTDGEG